MAFRVFFSLAEVKMFHLIMAEKNVHTVKRLNWMEGNCIKVFYLAFLQNRSRH